MKRTIIVVAGLCFGLLVPVAQAAPSLSIDQVVVPTGEAGADGVLDPNNQTTWHVGLQGIDAWDNADCSSTASYTGQDGTVDGVEANPKGPWDSWSFKAKTPGDWIDVPGADPDAEGSSSFNFLPLSRISASCDLTRKVYLGRHYYRTGVTFSRNGSATVHRGGCKIYSYTDGNLTIDCRGSSSGGSASWSYNIKPTDRATGSEVYFDTHQSTMGAHPVTNLRLGNTLYVTENVSPGTMITVTSVEASFSRLYSRKVYRHDSKTLSAHWLR